MPNAQLQVGVNNSGATRQLSLGSWVDESASGTGWGLFGGNMYLQEGNSNFTYSNTHDSIGAIAFATNYPGWNQASVITSGTTSSSAGNTFTPTSIATFQYNGKVGIGSSTPIGNLDVEPTSTQAATGTPATICLNGHCTSGLGTITQEAVSGGWQLNSNGAYYAAATAVCPSGSVATGGGAHCDSAGGMVALIYSNPVGSTGYYGSCVNLNYGTMTGAGTGNGVVAYVY